MKLLSKPLAILALLVIAGSAYVLGWSRLFVVERIIVESNDKKVVQDVLSKIKQSPAVVEIGQPLARVDRREIATRLREMLWIENINLDRRLISGELHITILPRNPIARLIPKDTTNLETIGFMDQDLEYFYLPSDAVARAIKAGEWQQVPELDMRRDSLALRQDVATLLKKLQEREIKVNQITAKDQLALRTNSFVSGRRLEITWGSVKDLELKIEILGRLLELKANRSVSRVDLSNPVSPIVSR